MSQAKGTEREARGEIFKRDGQEQNVRPWPCASHLYPEVVTTLDDIKTIGIVGAGQMGLRQFAGFGSADDTNRRFTYLLQHGQTGLSVALDMPILMGIAASDSRARGEVGHCGVAISSPTDRDRLFADIPLDQITTSMTINGPAAVIPAMYLAGAEKRGISVERLGGTFHNDILKEYIARKNGSSHLNPHCGSSPALSPTVRNRLLNGVRSASVGRGLSLSKAVEPRETCGVTGR